MAPLSNKEYRERHIQQREALKAKVNEAPVITLDVVDDAMLHLIDHWERPPGYLYQYDHVFLIGRGYIGEHKETAIATCAKLGYQRGSLRGLATDLASMMKSDPEFARCIFQALNLFKGLPPDGQTV